MFHVLPTQGPNITLRVTEDSETVSFLQGLNVFNEQTSSACNLISLPVRKETPRQFMIYRT